MNPSGQLAEIQKRFPDFAAQKIRPRKTSSLLKEIHPDAYAVYQLLCLKAHSNLHSIHRQHYAHMPIGRISAGRPADCSFAVFVTGMSAYCVKHACGFYLARLEAPQESRVAELERLFDRVNRLAEEASR